jgi:hypothetical protein
MTNPETSVVPAPDWLTKPTLQTAIIERIRGGGTLDEVKEYYRFMREIEAVEAERAATDDFVLMQGELPAVPKLGEIDIGKGKAQRYMRWEDINKLIKPVLTKHHFALNFHFVEESETHITMTVILKHRNGYIDSTTRRLPLDKSGSKNIVQAYGSTQSYAQRYLAIAILNLVAEGEDDDGGAEYVSEDQLEELRTELARIRRAEASYCEWQKIERLELMPAPRFQAAIAFLRGLGSDAAKNT